MPTARLSVQTTMRRAKLPAILIVAALLLTSLVPTQTVFACPPPPVPLRALFINSDLIVLARVAETTPVEVFVSGGKDAPKRYLMETRLKVSSTVKGQGSYGAVNVYHWGWQPDNKQYHHSLKQYSEGDKLLFFLRSRENGEGYELVDHSYSVKKLPEADLKVYLQRIDELALIMQQEKPDPAQIVEWLVRCAEETATRWEGLSELSMSNYALRFNERQQEEARAKEASESESGKQAADDVDGDAAAGVGAPIVEIKTEEFANINVAPRSSYLAPDANFMRLLTDSQKSRLANILFNSKTITYEEVPLLELVRQWNEPRLISFVMAQLRSSIDNPDAVAEPLVRFISEILDDEEVTRLTDKYCYETCYDDDLNVNGVQDESESETVSAGEAEEEPQEDEEAEAEAKEESDETEEPVAGNCAQKRSIRLKRFIARAESVMAR